MLDILLIYFISINLLIATHGVVIYISRTRDFRKITSACFRAYNIVHLLLLRDYNILHY